MRYFGVETEFSDNGLRIYKKAMSEEIPLLDFKTCPDLAQTIVALAAGLKKDIEMTGLETLKIKETDRIAALQTEIKKFGAEFIEVHPEVYKVQTQHVSDPGNLVFDTYEDHRMAMAFAPLALIFKQIAIREPNVVEKSYPMFWDHLKAQGFSISG